MYFQSYASMNYQQLLLWDSVNASTVVLQIYSDPGPYHENSISFEHFLELRQRIDEILAHILTTEHLQNVI